MRERAFAIIPRRTGLDPYAIADPAGGALARQSMTRVAEAFGFGDRQPFFSVLRLHADLARALGSAPAVDELIDTVCHLPVLAPWLQPRGCPILGELASLLCIEPFECAHVVEENDGTLHLLENGEALARDLLNVDAPTCCGLPVSAMKRAVRGSWWQLRGRRCRLCQGREQTIAGDNSQPSILSVRDEETQMCPLADTTLISLQERFANALAKRIRKNPERTRVKLETWVQSSYLPPLRLALGSTAYWCMHNSDNHEDKGRFRWALGGRYSHAEPIRQRLIDNQLDMLIEYTRVRDWQSACPTAAQLRAGTASQHLADRLSRRLFIPRS